MALKPVYEEMERCHAYRLLNLAWYLRSVVGEFDHTIGYTETLAPDPIKGTVVKGSKFGIIGVFPFIFPETFRFVRPSCSDYMGFVEISYDLEAYVNRAVGWKVVVDGDDIEVCHFFGFNHLTDMFASDTEYDSAKKVATVIEDYCHDRGWTYY